MLSYRNQSYTIDKINNLVLIGTLKHFNTITAKTKLNKTERKLTAIGGGSPNPTDRVRFSSSVRSPQFGGRS